MRCLHEASLQPDNVFLTLTYAPESLPPHGSLAPRDLCLFFKKLRRAFPARKLRYFAVGEYGDMLGRPHYHALVFNLDFADKKPIGKSKDGSLFYGSAQLDQIWGLGHTSVGSVTFESAAYCARYALKKITGKQAAGHYEIIDPDTGEIHERIPEFARMSNRPGLGSAWFDLFKSDCYPSDFLVHNGKPLKVPSFYDRKLPEETLAKIKESRKLKARHWRKDSTPRRLKDRETVKLSQLKQLKRGFQ